MRGSELEKDPDGPPVVIHKLLALGAHVFFKPTDLEGVFRFQIDICRIEMEELEGADPLFDRILSQLIFETRENQIPHFFLLRNDGSL